MNIFEYQVLNIPQELCPLVPFAVYLAAIGLGFALVWLCRCDGGNKEPPQNIQQQIKDIVLGIEEKVEKLSPCSCRFLATLPPPPAPYQAPMKQPKAKSALRPLKSIRSLLQRVIKANGETVSGLEELETLVNNEVNKIEDPNWR